MNYQIETNTRPAYLQETPGGESFGTPRPFFLAYAFFCWLFWLGGGGLRPLFSQQTITSPIWLAAQLTSQRQIDPSRIVFFLIE